MNRKAELVTRAMRLHEELRKIREKAIGLAFDDMRRWRLSIRAEKIGKQLKMIQEASKHERHP